MIENHSGPWTRPLAADGDLLPTDNPEFTIPGPPYNAAEKTNESHNHIPNPRQGRVHFRKSSDPNPELFYGDPIETKAPADIRIFLQNTKGLTYTIEGTDYEFYFRSLHDIQADVASLVETNTAWQHSYLRGELIRRARQIRDTTIKFSYATSTIDPAGLQETFQAGGTVTAVMGDFTHTVFGGEVTDPTGQGRWSGCTMRGKHSQMITILTAYRTYATTINSAPPGSVFSR
jgi:hypothetical protein